MKRGSQSPTGKTWSGLRGRANHPGSLTGKGNTVAFSWHLKTPAPHWQRPQLFWAQASGFRPHVGCAGWVPAASVRVAGAAGPFVPAGRRRPSAPSERAPVGDSAGPIASPRPSDLAAAVPPAPAPSSSLAAPGQNDLVLLFGLGKEVRARPGRGSPGRLHGQAVGGWGSPRLPFPGVLGGQQRAASFRESLGGAPAGPGLRLPPGPGLTSRNGAGEAPAPVGSGLRAGASWRARGVAGWGGGCAERPRSRPRGGGGDPPGYVAAIAAAARPLPTRPPTRPLAAGSCAAAFPGSDGERQCVLAPHARCVSPTPAPRTQLLASPAPRRRASGWRRERVADPRRSLDDTARGASTPRSRGR